MRVFGEGARLGLLFVGFVCKLEEPPRRFVITTGFVSFKCELEKRSILDSVTIPLPRPDPSVTILVATDQPPRLLFATFYRTRPL